MPIYPPLDDVNRYVWEICEVENCNAHVGKGGDYHYHGDPYGKRCLYSPANDENNHPGLYGYSLDGIPIYGRYTAAGQDSQALALDKCGGHTHGNYGYHYHSQVETSGDFIKYMQGPSNCWRGDISKIPNFWDDSGRQANYDNSKTKTRYIVSQRSDYEALKPCCGSTDYYTTSGFTLNLIENQTTAVETGSSASAPAPNPAGSNTSSTGATNVSPIQTNTSNNKVINYTFTTSNDLSYTCSSMGIEVKNEFLSCAQADAESSTSSSTQASSNSNNILKCSNDGVIKCFAFASLGKTSGSCAGDNFKDDGTLNTDVIYLPNDIGQSILNKNSYTFQLTQTTLNGISTGYPEKGPLPKLKVLAMCSTPHVSVIAVTDANSSASTGNPSSVNFINGEYIKYNIIASMLLLLGMLLVI